MKFMDVSTSTDILRYLGWSLLSFCILLSYTLLILAWMMHYTQTSKPDLKHIEDAVVRACVDEIQEGARNATRQMPRCVRIGKAVKP